MLKSALNHLLTNVLPAAQDYDRAENELSAAFTQNPDPVRWATAGQHAKRRAAEVAVAIDGLADRAANDLGITPESVLKQLFFRQDSINRVGATWSEVILVCGRRCPCPAPNVGQQAKSALWNLTNNSSVSLSHQSTPLPTACGPSLHRGATRHCCRFVGQCRRYSSSLL
jgi:hypothetical protein